jgi:hypothetical protein
VGEVRDLTDTEHAANKAAGVYLCQCPRFILTYVVWGTNVCTRCELPRRSK